MRVLAIRIPVNSNRADKNVSCTISKWNEKKEEREEKKKEEERRRGRIAEETVCREDRGG